MKALITGSNGFIGRHLTKRLSNLGFDLKLLSRKSFQDGYQKNIEIINGDLTDPNLAYSSSLVDDCEVVFHLAGETTDESKMYGLHVNGTETLLQQVRNSYASRPRKIHWIQLSSCGAYGASKLNTGVPITITELTCTAPQNIYESTKTIADDLIIDFAKNNDWFRYTIIRPSIVFGDGMQSNTLQKMAKLMKVGVWLPYHPLATANYVYIDDVIEAMDRCVTNPAALNQTFIVANDCEMSQFMDGILAGLYDSELLKFINRRFGYLSSRLINALPQNNFNLYKLSVLSRYIHFSNNHIKQKLNWSPATPLPEQIKKFVRSLK